MSKVYTFGPTFRAENSDTSRHLAECRTVEPETAFADLHANADWPRGGRPWTYWRRVSARSSTAPAREDELGMNKTVSNWYCDPRRYGSVSHAGFGLGFERTVSYMTGQLYDWHE